MKQDNTAIDNSLFEIVFERDVNNLEKNLALYLSESETVRWWHRMVAKQEYALQGWQRNKVYPDFIACVKGDRVLVLETKGLQLKGNDDTEYKKKLFDLLTNEQVKPLHAGNRYIRPIMVVRVERTGKDQRDGKRIHAEDAKDYLINRLSVDEREIRIKSSEKDELGDEDLLSPTSPVRYIITKEALQEGWDCPFAYVLVLLDKTTAQTAMTQMVGRVLRQPETRTTSIDTLNQCYVFCFDQDVKVSVQNVRKGLEEEGIA